MVSMQELRFRQIQASIQTTQISATKIEKTRSIRHDIVSISKDGIFKYVSIDDSDVMAYYGTNRLGGKNTGAQTRGCKSTEFSPIDEEKLSGICLPEKYESLRDSNGFFYHGKSISDYDLVRLAVAKGNMEVSEDKEPLNAVYEAFHVMVEKEAVPKYGWSSTKYSEDGKYTFTKNEDGTYKWHLVDDEFMGTSIDEIASWVATGTPNRNIETRYLHYLRKIDPELYEAAQNIGREVRNYNLLTECYKAGVIGEAQHDYDLNFLASMFGMNGSETFYALLCRAKATGDYTCLIAAYQPEVAGRMQEIRIKQIEKTGGIL